MRPSVRIGSVHSMTVKTFKIVLLRPGCTENWERLSRPENPLSIALNVLNDPESTDTTLDAGLPIVWHQRVGVHDGGLFRVVYSLGRDERGYIARVSYVAPA